MAVRPAYTFAQYALLLGASGGKSASAEIRCTQLLAEGELAPGMMASEFTARRQRLAECLPAGTVALIAAPPVTYMSGAVRSRR